MSVLLDAAAALLMLAGAAFILIAAVGVARLPDIFVRMHAATKAAVFGVGLLLLGTAFAFGEPGVWVRVAAAILFLIFTTPIAAHALARASYAAGAPLWRGTVVDQLAEAPTDQVGGFKRASMTGPAALQRSAGKTVGTTEEESMTILSFDARNGESRHAPRTRTDGQPHLRRILVGLLPGEEGRATIDHAIRLARQTGAELVGLSIVDMPGARRVGPVPLGAGHYAWQLSEHRLRKARDEAADLVSSFELAASDAGVRYAVHHEEGDPCRLIANAAGSFDLVVIPTGGRPDGGAPTLRTGGVDALLSAGVRPILTGGTARETVRHVLLVHSPGSRAADTVRWFAQTRLWPEAVVHIADCTPASADAADELQARMENCAAYLAAHGYASEPLAALGAGSVDLDPLAALPFRCDAIVIANAGGGGLLHRFRVDTNRRLREAACPVILG